MPRLPQFDKRFIKPASLDETVLESATSIPSNLLANWSSNRNAGENRLTNLADGTGATDAVTLQQLEAATAGGGLVGVNEEPTGTKNGTNKVFTLSTDVRQDFAALVWEGVTLRNGVDFEFSDDDEITLLTAAAPEEDDELWFLGFEAPSGE